MPPGPLADVTALVASVREGPLGRVPRWVHLETLHLTVRFLGDTSPDLVPAVADGGRRGGRGPRGVRRRARGRRLVPARRQDPDPVARARARGDGAGRAGRRPGPRAGAARLAAGPAPVPPAHHGRPAGRRRRAPTGPRSRRCWRTRRATSGRRSVPTASSSIGATSAAARRATSRSSRSRCATDARRLPAARPRARLRHLTRTLPSPVIPGGTTAMATVLHRRTKFVLDEERIPKAWYNIAADLPVPPSPPLHPGTGQPIGPADLAPLFPMALILQEVSQDREVEIPEPIREAYQLYRPSPLYRAHRLEAALGTPAHIYYKYEGVSPAGSHKPNTAIPQAWFNKQEGVDRLATETGAGQWGSALSFAAALFGLEVKVYMVRASYDQKPYRRMLMETYGASVVRQPQPGHQLRPQGARRDPGLARLAGHRDQRGRRGRRDPRRHQVQPGLGAQPRAPPPDGDRPGVDRADGDGGRGARRDHRVRRRRLELRRPDVPVGRPQAARRRRPTGSSPPSPRPRRRSPAASTPTTSATPAR